MVQTLRRSPVTGICNGHAIYQAVHIATGYSRTKRNDPLVTRPDAKGALFRSLNLQHGASGIRTCAIHDHLLGLAFHTRGKHELGLLDFVGGVVIRCAVDGHGTGANVRLGVTIQQID